MEEAKRVLSEALRTPISVVLQKRSKRPVWVKSTDGVEKAFKKIFKNKIRSLPLFDMQLNRFTNFIEIAKTHTSPLREVYESLSHYTCADVANLAGRSSFVPIDDAVPLDVAISEIRFAGLERLVVLNPECELVGVLSQSCIVQFLSSSITKLEVSGHDIDSLQLGYRDVPTVQEIMLVSEAFKFLYQRGLDAVGIVNDRDELVGNLSASDLRNAECESLEIFSSLSSLTVKKFMKRMGQKQITTVKPTDTVARVTKLFAKKKFHQIYVISPTGSTKELLGVIRLEDILDLVVRVLEVPW